MLSQYTPFIYVITLGLLGASCSHLSDQQIYGASANANKEENTNSNSCAEKVSMDCIICLDNLNLKTVTTIEPCSHRFHKNCMLLLMHAQYISNKQNHEDEIARRAVQTSSQNIFKTYFYITSYQYRYTLSKNLFACFIISRQCS